MQARDVNDHHVADLLPAHQDDETPEAELRVEQDRRAVAREDAVEDHRPDVAEHDAADEVRHEEHRAVQVAALDALRERVGHRKGQHVDEHERYDGKQRREPERMHKARILERAAVVFKADKMRVARDLEFAEGEIDALAERIDKADDERADHRPHKEREPAADRAADHRAVDRSVAVLMFQFDQLPAKDRILLLFLHGGRFMRRSP